MSKGNFNYLINDAQGTNLQPITIEDFDINEYVDYEASLLESNHKFWLSKSGVVVYRRFRVPDVYSYGCRDIQLSLGLQLAALKQSMSYKTDIANFLEPWYGIGTVSASFGAEYIWKENQAPATKWIFNSVEDALSADPVPIEETGIGKHTLKMIEFFLDKTQGRIPISLTDTQSPLNVASFLIETNNFYMSFLDNPEGLKTLLGRISNFLIDFTKKQIELIGNALVKPGHGFASSRCFAGLGMSDDVTINLSPKQILEFDKPFLCKVGDEFEGSVFHSCGDWSSKAQTIKEFPGLLMVDGAFTPETDPAYNQADIFSETFSGTGIIINARMVGDYDTVIDKVRQLWKSGMKLIAVTYSQTPQEQEKVYDKIHEICST